MVWVDIAEELQRSLRLYTQMASLQTWSSSSHFRHPWFDTTVSKRKQPSPPLPDDMDDNNDGDFNSNDVRAPPTKRRRYTTLENGFAHLSLDPSHTLSDANSTRKQWGVNAPLVEEFEPPSDVPLQNVTLPDSIEEEEASAPEVQMKVSTWYEPEPNRIVITDLDGFADSDEETAPASSADRVKGFEVHPAFLEQIRSGQQRKMDHVPSPSPTTSQALVLFRPPPPLLRPASPDQVSSPPSETSKNTQQVVEDEYAMDLDTD
ncbi:hypothetical protein CC2G_009181 [Coprinopsis cinerea AmutBmut pab1-1]|nr:hypothetical protein CC2G_009181 [Coprinopsis cinerea AmutBmut pab1-1]